jgi:5-methylcytosine-specific restriction endonuclease McrA
MNIYDEYADTPETAPKIHSTLPSKNADIRKLRSSKEYQNVREQYRSRAKAHHNPDGSKGERCWLCGEAIDYRLRFPHPRSWSLDHAVPIKDNPALMLHPGNFRSAHLDCNNHRGSDAPRIEMGEPSEIW